MQLRSKHWLSWVAQTAIGAVIAGSLGASHANLNSNPCGSRGGLAYDACMQQSGASSSNPVIGPNGGGNPGGSVTKDPINRHRPPDWPAPVVIPRTKTADDSGRGDPGAYPGQRVPKPTGAAARSCSTAAIKARCRANMDCIRQAQSICADLAP